MFIMQNISTELELDTKPVIHASSVHSLDAIGYSNSVKVRRYDIDN